MNASSLTSRQRPRWSGWALALVLTLTTFLSPARAVELPPPAFVPATAATVTAPADLQSLLGNRTRMIQTATIVMMVAIAFLMWGKK